MFSILSDHLCSLLKNIFLLIAAAFIVSGCLNRQAVVPPSAPLRVAVLPFESSNSYVSGVALSDLFAVEILKSLKGVQVVERTDLEKVLQEHRMALAGLTESQKYMRVGTVIEAQAILTGSVQTLRRIDDGGGGISVTVKLMEVSTGRLLWADNEKISLFPWLEFENSEVAETLMHRSAKKMVRKMQRQFSRLAVNISLSKSNKKKK